jgi:type IV secretion system protein TrbI
VVADSLLDPSLAVAKPKGLPPKKLIVSVFAMMAGAALLLSFFSTSQSTPTTGDGLARDAAAKLSEKDRNDVGRTVPVVRDTADKSGLPADFKSAAGATQTQPLPPGTVPNPAAVVPAAAQPIGKPGPQASRASAADPVLSGVDPAVAAREVEVLNSSLVVFDDTNKTQGAAQPAAPANDIERHIQQLQSGAAAAAASGASASATSTAGNSAEETAKRLLEASQPPKQPRPRQLDAQFVSQFAEQRAKPGLRPNPKEAASMVLEGTVIPAVLTRSIVTDLPGVVTAVVNRDVYDSLTGRRLLICKGAHLVGRYNNEVQSGQSRLLFAFTRLTLLDGSSFDLGGFNGSDGAGAAGVEGDVNNHFLRIFGTSLAIGFLADRLTMKAAIPQGQNGQRSATGQIMVDTANEYLARFRTVAPTITIPQGAPINVEVRRDMVFPADSARSCT